MKSIFNISVVCFFLLLSACHKDNSGNSLRLLKSISIGGNPCSITYQYDNQNRLLSVTQCDTVESYSYTGDSVIYTKVQSNLRTYQCYYVLDTNGLATAFTKVSGEGITQYTLSYDDNKHLVRQDDNTHTGNFITYLIQGGNKVLESATLPYTGDDYSILSIYYKNTDNQLSNDNFGLGFLGKSSVNFLKGDIISQNGQQFELSYTYQLDNMNGVSARMTTMSDSVIETRTYQYY